MKEKLDQLMHKLAGWVVAKRRLITIVMLVITVIFGYAIKNVVIKTNLAELLPTSHPFIETHRDYADQLGDPFKIFFLLKVKEGTIYTTKTLQKIKEITDDLDKIPGVNHGQLYSLSSPKLKKVIIGEEGTTTEAIMPEVPQTEEKIQELRGTVRRTETVYGLFISRDEKAALFTASFIPEFSDYGLIHNKIEEIISKQKDPGYEFYASGEPLLASTIARLRSQMNLIFIITTVAVAGLLLFYFRNLVGMAVPLICGIICAIWGLGVPALLKVNIDPLGLVVPLLITARALSHSVQMVERYFEAYNELQDVEKAAKATIVSIFPPGTLGIIADVVGILFVALAPIPMIQKLAYICSWWAISILFNCMIVTPIILMWFRPPRNIPEIVQTERGAVIAFLKLIGRITSGKRSAYVVLGVTLALTAFCSYRAFGVKIGDILPGSSILWPNSFYNVSIDKINRSFPGVEELYVLFEGENPGKIKAPEMIKKIANFQRYMEESKDVVTTFSIGDCVPPYYKNLNFGYPKWEVIPDDPAVMGNLIYLMTAGSSPGDYDKYFSRDFRSANVVVYYRDHKGSTLRDAVDRVKEFIRNNPIEGIKIRLASGYLGIMAAVNEAVERTQLLNFICVMSLTFLICALTYRSCMAALYLIIPINITNILGLALMTYMGIGLNINTLPVVSLGIGVGIDYGIYLLSRICEEYQSLGDYEKATTRALQTTGKATFFTATTMATGTIFWYFMSSLRFCAEMGLLLTFLMGMNMVMALVVLPNLVYIFKPKFVSWSGFKP